MFVTLEPEIRDVFAKERQTISPEYISGLAASKRFLEFYSMEPGFQEEFSHSPEKTLQRYAIPVDVLDMKILSDPATAKQYADCPVENIPIEVRRYRNFIKEKIASRENYSRHLCVPAQSRFQAWRQRQVNRCWWDLGTKNSSLIHAPIMFELTSGCSVGCPFCGVAAKKFSGIFPYTDENRVLWRKVLRYAHKFIGDAAGSGTCYYATEPLDNPDYEKFNDDFYAEFSTYPQITTAVSMRDPERTRRLLHKMKQYELRVHRFSVTSLAQFHQICAFFSPEELLEVELLPQYTEAPSCRFSNTGRARSLENREKVNPSHLGATISCISGFVVNMVEKSIRLLTPWQVDAEHPTGERFLAQTGFVDAEDFRDRMIQLVEQYMPEKLPLEQVLKLSPSIGYREIEDGVEFFIPEQFNVKFSSTEVGRSTYYDIASLLAERKYTVREIAENLVAEKNIFPAHVFHFVGKVFSSGLLEE